MVLVDIAYPNNYYMDEDEITLKAGEKRNITLNFLLPKETKIPKDIGIVFQELYNKEIGNKIGSKFHTYPVFVYHISSDSIKIEPVDDWDKSELVLE